MFFVCRRYIFQQVVVYVLSLVFSPFSTLNCQPGHEGSNSIQPSTGTHSFAIIGKLLKHPVHCRTISLCAYVYVSLRIIVKWGSRVDRGREKERKKRERYGQSMKLSVLSQMVQRGKSSCEVIRL